MVKKNVLLMSAGSANESMSSGSGSSAHPRPVPVSSVPRPVLVQGTKKTIDAEPKYCGVSQRGGSHCPYIETLCRPYHRRI